jgi:hypothetical protein
MPEAVTMGSGSTVSQRCEIERQPLATPNYAYEKRQRELAKKKKKEEKLQRKAQQRDEPGTAQEPAGQDAAPDAASQAPARES